VSESCFEILGHMRDILEVKWLEVLGFEFFLARTRKKGLLMSGLIEDFRLKKADFAAILTVFIVLIEKPLTLAQVTSNGFR